MTMGRSKRRKSPKLIWLGLVVGLIAGLFAAAGVYRYLSVTTLAEPGPDIFLSTPEVTQQPLVWPSYGQSAVAASGFGVLETHGQHQAQPTASTAKLITLLAVLQKKPIEDGLGATIKFGPDDVARYHDYLAGNGSVVQVADGLEWTEYQAFQAVLLKSANNVSDSLAIWAFGSLDNYRSYAQEMVEDLGMNGTIIGADASGYSATTVSTAHDMAVLGLEIMKQPVLREITSQSEAILPYAGQIINTNKLLMNDHDIIGLKTGFINESGGVFVLGGELEQSGHKLDIVTVVMGAPGEIAVAARHAQNDAYKLFISAKSNFTWQIFVKLGQKVGEYRAAWSDQPRAVVTTESLERFLWSGDHQIEAKLDVIKLPAGQGGQVGQLKISQDSWTRDIPVKVDQPFDIPSVWWRLSRSL